MHECKFTPNPRAEMRPVRDARLSHGRLIWPVTERVHFQRYVTGMRGEMPLIWGIGVMAATREDREGSHQQARGKVASQAIPAGEIMPRITVHCDLHGKR